MILALIQKDLRRVWRNPAPYLIHLALPLVITALIGVMFGGGGSSGNRMGRIQLAIVDEDESPLTDFLRGALSQREAGEYFDVQVLPRTEAVRLIEANKLSAVWVIPEGFTRGYLDGVERQAFELIKNPAQTYYPAIVEEMLSLITVGLDGLSRGLRTELPAWRELLEGGEDFDLLRVAGILQEAGQRLEAVRPYVYPPLVRYTKDDGSLEAAGEGGEAAGGGEAGVGDAPFAFLLAGLAGVFLLFIADRAVRDFFIEIERHTLERFHSLREDLMVFVAAKSFFAMIVLWVAAGIMLLGGAFLFRFSWQTPWQLVALVVAYSLAATGLMSVISAVAGSPRRADLFNNIVAMGLGLAGGCMFPPQQLPAFLREQVAPWLPTHWFANSVRQLQYDGSDAPWVIPVLSMLMLGAVGLGISTFLFRRRMEKGVKP